MAILNCLTRLELKDGHSAGADRRSTDASGEDRKSRWRELTIGSTDGWQMVVVYRGQHCPLCRRYLAELNQLLDEYHNIGVEVVVASGDPRGTAENEAAEEGWRFPVGYDLTIDQMRLLGLYISEPRSSAETDRPFAEPGLFIVKPVRPWKIGISEKRHFRSSTGALAIGHC
jgi:peroxiredoxin